MQLLYNSDNKPWDTLLVEIMGLTSSIELLLHVGIMGFLTYYVIFYLQHPSPQPIPKALVYIAGFTDIVYGIMGIPLLYSVYRFY